MTSTPTETPDEVVRGYYGSTRPGHARNLLARSTVAGSAAGLTPEIIGRMRRHYQVASCLLVQSLPLIRADWSIECDDERIREAMTTAYQRVAFTVHRSMTRALAAGYSPNTLTWDAVDELPVGFPVEVRDLEPRTCRPWLDDAGTLDGFVQTVAGAGDDPFPALYCLWIVEGMESGNYYGRSILDAALDPWADFTAIRSFHARYLERFGEPVVLARAPAGKTIVNSGKIQAAVDANLAAGLSPGDPGYLVPPDPILLDNLDTALETGENLRHHSVVALPSTLLTAGDGKSAGYSWQLEYLEAAAGGGGDFLEALRETEKRIARAMFVPDLLASNGGESGGGAYALGQTHRSIWHEATEGRLDDYSRQITDQLLEPARVLNYGPASSPCRLVFSPLTDEARDRVWSLVESLCNAGRLPDVDARELAESVGLPLLDGDEIPPDPEPDPDPEPAELRRAASPLTLAADPTAGLPDWRLPQSYDPPPWRRELTTRERRVGFARIEGGMNGAEGDTIRKLSELLDVEHDRILRQLAGIIRREDTEAGVLAALGTLEIKSSGAVAKAWADLMGEVGGLAVDALRSELADYANVLPFDVGAEGRALFRSYATTSADRVLSGILTETRLGLLNAYTSGVSRPGMAAIVGQVFDAHTTSEAKPIRLTTRMLSSKALNHSRAAAVEAGGIPLAGAQYSAILDRRTCDLCRKLDERVIRIESTDLARFTPPVHHNCRCVWVWITRDEPDFTPTWSTPSKSDVDRFGGLVLG